MIGATGRLYVSGSEADVRQAADAAEDALLTWPPVAAGRSLMRAGDKQ